MFSGLGLVVPVFMGFGFEDCYTIQSLILLRTKVWDLWGDQCFAQLVLTVQAVLTWIRAPLFNLGNVDCQVCLFTQFMSNVRPFVIFFNYLCFWHGFLANRNLVVAARMSLGGEFMAVGVERGFAVTSCIPLPTGKSCRMFSGIPHGCMWLSIRNWGVTTTKVYWGGMIQLGAHCEGDAVVGTTKFEMKIMIYSLVL
ncbi:hypothetical protein AKJ16_DCAP02844 [Drosera capensis]